MEVQKTAIPYKIISFSRKGKSVLRKKHSTGGREDEKNQETIATDDFAYNSYKH